MKLKVSLFMLIFLAFPLSVLAAESERKESPFDVISSSGEVIYAEDYLEDLEEIDPEKIKDETAPREGNPELMHEPKSIDSSIIKKGSNKLLDSSVGTRVVIGDDGRKKVTDILKTPNKEVGFMLGGSGGSSCTGTLIDSDKYLTNAHCVDGLGSPSQTTFYPGILDSKYYWGAYVGEEYYKPRGWDGKDSAFDFAIVKVKPYKSGDDYLEAGDFAGTLGIKETSTGTTGNQIKIQGYPGDLINKAGTVSQYQMSGSILRDNNYQNFYKIDTFGGNSGSAQLNSSNQIVGVHNGSYTINGETFNGGPKMSRGFHSFVVTILLTE